MNSISEQSVIENVDYVNKVLEPGGEFKHLTTGVGEPVFKDYPLREKLSTTLADIKCTPEAMARFIQSGNKGYNEVMSRISAAILLNDEKLVDTELFYLRKVIGQINQFDEQQKDLELKQNATDDQSLKPNINKYFKGWANLATAPKPEPIADWLWKGMIKKGVSAAVVGHGEAGKGMFVSGLAVCVAAGVPYLNQPCNQGKVLIISAEDDIEEMLSRLHDIAAALNLSEESVKRNIAIFSTADAGVSPALLSKNMEPTELLFEIARVAEKVQPVLVVIDTLAACAPAGVQLTDSTAATQYICGVIAALQPTSGSAPTVLFTHHLRKPEKNSDQRPSIHDVRDSGAIVGSMRSVLILHKETLSLDKCNGRRRVEREWLVGKDDAFKLEWKSATGCFNGALVLQGKESLADLEVAEKQRATENAEQRARSKKEDAEKVKKNDQDFFAKSQEVINNRKSATFGNIKHNSKFDGLFSEAGGVA